MKPATLTPVRSYILRIGDTGLGAFRVDSEWNGLTRLVSENDPALHAIVATPEATSMRLHFIRALDPAAPEQVQIVQLSPKALALLLPEDLNP